MRANSLKPKYMVVQIEETTITAHTDRNGNYREITDGRSCFNVIEEGINSIAEALERRKELGEGYIVMMYVE